uniref:Uncharacterized protein n=1 Tax=Rhizophora mucronata TaxID=61149 RepID=A0A2P2KVU6_RHIMU
MDARRGATAVPKVRHVGFFTPNAPPSRSQSGPPVGNSPPLSDSPASNSLSPVMIPPPRHHSENLAHRATSPLPVPEPTAFRRPLLGDHVPVVGSYNSLLSNSPPMLSHSSRIGDGEFSEESSPGWFPRSNSAKFASSFPSGGFDLTLLKPSQNSEVEAEKSVKAPASGEDGAEIMQNERPPNSKPLKAKTTKAERRALQESQRAAKTAAKVSEGAATKKSVQQQPSQSKETALAAVSIVGSDRKGGDRLPEKERKKDAPPPRMQFDDKNRVEKAKRRALVNQTEARNRVELFRHLPQYEHGTQLPDLESKFFQLEVMHPAVYKVLLYLDKQLWPVHC